MRAVTASRCVLVHRLLVLRGIRIAEMGQDIAKMLLDAGLQILVLEGCAASNGCPEIVAIADVCQPLVLLCGARESQVCDTHLHRGPHSQPAPWS